MSEAVDTKIHELKQAIDQKKRLMTKAELEHDAASATVEKAQKRLQDEFGVSTVDEAKKVLAGMRTELDEAVESAFAALSKANDG